MTKAKKVSLSLVLSIAGPVIGYLGWNSARWIDNVEAQIEKIPELKNETIARLSVIETHLIHIRERLEQVAGTR